jgi:predicted nuclease of predicted toxin-antitoxin system
MSLRFLADQCVPGEVSDFLSNSGYEVVLLRDVLPIRSPDSIVIQKAQELGAILVSLNGDFADIVAYPPRSFLGIVALQLHNHPEIIPKLLRHLCNFLRTEPHQAYYAGKLLIVEVHRIRIRT